MENGSGYGALALLPPLVAILLAFITKRVLVSLFLGILAGGIIIAGYNPLAGVEYSLDTVTNSITDEWNARLLLFNLLMGSGVAFIWRLGGSSALTSWAKPKIKNRKQAGLGAWILGIVVFFNDYVNAAIVGNVFRDIYEDMKISKEKLSYILDSTAAPVATFFISDWIAFQIGMIQSGLDAAELTGVSAFTTYLHSIPYNLYCILAVLIVGITIYLKKDFGPMLKAETRAKTKGETSRKGSTPMMDVGSELGEAKNTRPMLASFFMPIVALVIVTLFGFWYTGRPAEDLMGMLAKTDPAKALLWGAFAMSVTGIVIALVFRIMKLKEVMETVIDGMKLMLLACAILVLAWSLGTVTKDMNLADYIIGITGGNIPFGYMPFIIFIMGMLIAFSTGTSWGAMTILTPIAIPLAYKMTGDPLSASLMAGAVFSGAIFGDHCSPISDTTVLASIFSGADHMDHVTTQIPYALTAAISAGILYLWAGFTETGPVWLVLAGIILVVLLIYSLNTLSVKYYGLNR